MNIAIQILNILREIHSQGIIYRDIKPENFLIGSTEETKNKIYICDFGLAKYYMVPKYEESKTQTEAKVSRPLLKKGGLLSTLSVTTASSPRVHKVPVERTEHIPLVDGKSLVGTPRYASLNTHRGLEQSRRDDLETLGHMLIYFFHGNLPWSGLKTDNK